jgi:hypothetical protein
MLFGLPLTAYANPMQIQDPGNCSGDFYISKGTRLICNITISDSFNNFVLNPITPSSSDDYNGTFSIIDSKIPYSDTQEKLFYERGKQCTNLVEKVTCVSNVTQNLPVGTYNFWFFLYARTSAWVTGKIHIVNDLFRTGGADNKINFAVPLFVGFVVLVSGIEITGLALRNKRIANVLRK